jgi:hypothetical protein
MTSARNRQLVLLTLLIVVGAVAFVMWPFGGPAPGTPGAAPGQAGNGARGAGGGTGIEVRLESLQREHGPLQESDRNPFRFERRQAPSAPTGASRRQAPVVPQPEGPVLPPPPPPIPLRFIGYLQPRDGAARVAVLSDGRGNVFDGKEGDIIEGRYRVLRVGNDSADLIYLDGRGRQTIRLSGQ